MGFCPSQAPRITTDKTGGGAAQSGHKIAEVEGADVGSLTAAVSQHLKKYRSAAPQVLANGNGYGAPEPPRGTPAAASSSTPDRIKALLASAPVLLCMKGTPEAPRCGFSSKVVAALRDVCVPFSSFDILTDEAIRQALKVCTFLCRLSVCLLLLTGWDYLSELSGLVSVSEWQLLVNQNQTPGIAMPAQEYSNWPTYPQLYANGELLGGCDIILEMHASKELKSAIDDALGSPQQQNGQASLQQRLQQLIDSHSVMLFMKVILSGSILCLYAVGTYRCWC